MTTEDKFDGKHYITAQVIIPADDFAKEMLGENPTPQKLEEFIKDNASMMDVVYGTAEVAPKDKIMPDTRQMLHTLIQKADAIKGHTEYVATRIANAIIEEANTRARKPIRYGRKWWQRVLGIYPSIDDTIKNL